jgi:tRNA 2-thiouridine synthesizing protein A
VAECKVDVCGKNCPAPLVEFRKAVRQTSPGDIIEITGTHPESKKEIPMAVKSLKLELLGIEEEGGKWTIKVRR